MYLEFKLNSELITLTLINLFYFFFQDIGLVEIALLDKSLYPGLHFPAQISTRARIFSLRPWLRKNVICCGSPRENCITFIANSC